MNKRDHCKSFGCFYPFSGVEQPLFGNKLLLLFFPFSLQREGMQSFYCSRDPQPYLVKAPLRGLVCANIQFKILQYLKHLISKCCLFSVFIQGIYKTKDGTKKYLTGLKYLMLRLFYLKFCATKKWLEQHLCLPFTDFCTRPEFCAQPHCPNGEEDIHIESNLTGNPNEDLLYIDKFCQ